MIYLWRFWHWLTRNHAWAKHNEWAHGVECHRCRRPYHPEIEKQ